MKKLFIIVLLLLAGLSASAASAAHVWIAQTTQGGDTGADAANAHSYTWFNTAGNWGSGASQIGPGTIVHLTGTFNGSANQTMLIPPGSGSSGNPVTIKFETGCMMKSPVWGRANALVSYIKDGAIYINNVHDIVIDGNNLAGVITNTDNGAFGQTYSQPANGIHIEDASNITVSNLNVVGMYLNNNNAAGERADAIRTDGALTNIRITGCYLTDCNAGVSVDFKVLTNLEIDHCTTRRHTWGIGVTPTHGYSATIGDGSVSLGYVKIHDNDISDWTGWMCPGDRFHTDGVFVWSYNHMDQGPMTCEMYNNYVHGNLRTGACSATAFLFARNQEGDSAAVIQAKVYNNLVLSLDGGTGIWLLCVDGTTVENNTVISLSGSDDHGLLVDIGPIGVTNNIFLGWSMPMSSIYGNVIKADYNDYGGNNIFMSEGFTGGPQHWWSLNGGGSQTGDQGNPYSSRTMLNADLHSFSSNPLLDGSYRPTASSPVVKAGANLYSVFTFDKDSNGRTNAGPWDIGAYVYNGAPPTDPVIGVSPSSINYGWAVTNTSTNLTFTVQNTGYGTLSGSAGTAPPWTIVGTASYNLTAGQSQTITVAFTPTSKGAVSGTVNLTGGGNAVVSLSGYGLWQLPYGSIWATNGYVEAPMATASDYVYLSTTTLPNGPPQGRVTYVFNVPSPGQYYATGIVNWPNVGSNSLYIAVDRDPVDGVDVWGLPPPGPTTTGFQPLAVTLPDQPNQSHLWTLTAGNHTLVIMGREQDAELEKLMFYSQSIEPTIPPPSGLHIGKGRVGRLNTK